MVRISFLSLFPVEVTGPQPSRSGPTGTGRREPNCDGLPRPLLPTEVLVTELLLQYTTVKKSSCRTLYTDRDIQVARRSLVPIGVGLACNFN
jgi:hypothetical protein